MRLALDSNALPGIVRALSVNDQIKTLASNDWLPDYSIISQLQEQPGDLAFQLYVPITVTVKGRRVQPE
jgi:hypothetical protein